jgi:hypothetical protein
MAINKIGEVATDCGALVIIDPSLLPEEIRNQVCAPTIGQRFGESLGGAAFSFATGRDGAFTVDCSFDPDNGDLYKITVVLK